jgi:hypothetical protein
MDSEAELEPSTSRNLGYNVFSIDSLSEMDFYPSEPISSFQLTVLYQDGTVWFDMPRITANILEISNYFTLVSTLNSMSNQYTQDEINSVISLWNTGAITLQPDRTLSFDMETLYSNDLVSEMLNGRYYVHLELNNEQGDTTDLNFEVILNDYIPSVYIDSIIPTNNGYTIMGVAHGVNSITMNNVTTEVVDGLFELETTINETIQYSYIDYFGNTYQNSESFRDDFVPPIITLSSENDIVILEGEDYVLPTCTVLDNRDANLECSISGEPENTLIPGDYTIAFSAIDQYGNRTTTSINLQIQQVQINDTTPPVISLSNQSNIKIKVGEMYTLPTCSATDDIDQNINCLISGIPNDTNTPGAYDIVFSAVDSSGNQSIQKTVRLIIEEEITDEPIIEDTGCFSTISRDTYFDQLLIIIFGIGIIFLYRKDHIKEE